MTKIKISKSVIYRLAVIFSILVGVSVAINGGSFVKEAEEYVYVYHEPDYSKFPPLRFGAYRDRVTGLVYYKNKKTDMWIDASGNVGIGTASPGDLSEISVDYDSLDVGTIYRVHR